MIGVVELHRFPLILVILRAWLGLPVLQSPFLSCGHVCTVLLQSFQVYDTKDCHMGGQGIETALLFTLCS